ncbi:MAG: hypothetical protein IIA45_01840 [Bacteroidetes bacterium]|nr:hypothetical protein [Bacteroidota bacterium]
MWRAIFFTILFFSALFLSVIELPHFDNTIRGLSLFYKWFFIGIGTAIILVAAIKSIRNHILALVLMISLSLLFPSLFCLTNRVFYSSERMEKFSLVSKDMQLYRVEKYFVFIEVDGREERLTVDRDFFKETLLKNSITLPVRKGYWGYDYVVLDISCN